MSYNQEVVFGYSPKWSEILGHHSARRHSGGNRERIKLFIITVAETKTQNVYNDNKFRQLKQN